MTLRIQRAIERTSVVFILTGRIRADQVPDVEALLKSESSDCDVILDLRHVKLVDRDAVLLLVSTRGRWDRTEKLLGVYP